MADRGAPGRPGETAVRDQGYHPVQLPVADDRFRRHQHLRHAGSPRSFIADDHDLAAFDFTPDHCGVRGFLAVKHARGPPEAPHFFRAGGILDDRAFRRQVALQDRNGTGLLRPVWRQDHIFLLQCVIVQVSFAALEESALPQVLKVLSQRLPGDRHHVQVQVFAQQPLYGRNTAREPESFRQVLSAREDVPDVRNDPVDLVKFLNIQVDPKFPGNGRKVQRCVR